MGGFLQWTFETIILCLICSASLQTGFTPRLERVSESANNREQWGYSEVRRGAHMFWWLYRTTHPDGYLKRPLLIWLQGGPGFSSSGLGNFGMLGPLDERLQPRNKSWVQLANVLFVDNPVGAGFSYVDPWTPLAGTSEAIATDLVAMLGTFLDHNPEFKSIPLFIFGQSYGGKMTVAFGKQLKLDIEAGKIAANLTGVALGNAWISPIDSILNWAPLLLHMSVMDQVSYQRLHKLAKDVEDSISASGYTKATTEKWMAFTGPILDSQVDLYNILRYHEPKGQSRKKRDTTGRSYVTIGSLYDVEEKPLMEKLIRKKLAIIPDSVEFQEFSGDVYVSIEGNDFLAPVLDGVDVLLSKGVDVVVYQGQLDLVCPTNGAQDWLKKLKWPQLSSYNMANRTALYNKQNDTIMFVKSHQNFKFYWILDAGHAVPFDTPGRAFTMLTRILDRVDT